MYLPLSCWMAAVMPEQYMHVTIWLPGRVMVAGHQALLSRAGSHPEGHPGLQLLSNMGSALEIRVHIQQRVFEPQEVA